MWHLCLSVFLCLFFCLSVCLSFVYLSTCSPLQYSLYFRLYSTLATNISVILASCFQSLGYDLCFSSFTMAHGQCGNTCSSRSSRWPCLQKRFPISEVAADWHELMISQHTMRPSIARVNEKLHLPIVHTISSPHNPFPILLRVGGWVDLNTH